jgi:hypothetical protein
VFTIFRWFRRLVYLLVLVAFAYLVLTSAQVVLASRSTAAASEVKPAAAIVVIGSATGPGPLAADLKLRCEEAVSLYRQGRSHRVITTGASSSSGSPTEASAAASYLRSQKVLHITELPASSIPDQLQAVGKLLAPGGGAKVILVADPLQTKWLEELAGAEHLHVQIVAVPAPKGSFWGDIGTIWSQTVAVALGRIVGYQNTTWISG